MPGFGNVALTRIVPIFGAKHVRYVEENVRAILLSLINLLHAEEEMLTSCVVRHYVTIIQGIQADAARVTL